MMSIDGTNFFFQAEDGIRDYKVTGVQTCALPISPSPNPCIYSANRCVEKAPPKRTGLSFFVCRVVLASFQSLPVGRRSSIAPPASFERDRKSTRLNSSHLVISYAVFCLKKKKTSRVRQVA